MPATLTAASAQRAIHTRRTQLRRGALESVTAEGTRSSGDSEDKSEESEVTAGSVSNNRFSVLRPKEPAPGIQEKQEPTIPQRSIFRLERPITPPIQTDTLPADQPLSSGRFKDKSRAPTSSAVTYTKRPKILRLAPHTPINSRRIESSQHSGAPAAATVSPMKPQARPSPLALQAEAQSVRSLRPPSASARISPDFDTADPSLSLLAPEPGPTLPSPPTPPDPMSEPCLATLPLPPIPQDPMGEPCLATLPIHPSLDFRSITSPKYSRLKSRQFTPPPPTSWDNFHTDDPMRHVVRTTSGKIFTIAAEIAAANEKCSMRPVGKILIPGPANKLEEAKEKIDRRNLDHEGEGYVNSHEDMKYGSEGEDREGEGWLGKDEGFWEQPFEKGCVVRSRSQRRKEESL